MPLEYFARAYIRTRQLYLSHANKPTPLTIPADSHDTGWTVGISHASWTTRSENPIPLDRGQRSPVDGAIYQPHEHTHTRTPLTAPSLRPEELSHSQSSKPIYRSEWGISIGYFSARASSPGTDMQNTKNA